MSNLDPELQDTDDEVEEVIPEPARFPNDQYVLDLTGETRLSFFEQIKQVYTTIKEAGFNVPSVTIKGEGDASYIEYELIKGDNIRNLVLQGKITEEKAGQIRKEAIKMVDAIREKTGISVYNVHSANIFYAIDLNKTYLFDVIQSNVNHQAPQVTRHTEAYLAYLAQKEADRKTQEETNTEDNNVDEEEEEA